MTETDKRLHAPGVNHDAAMVMEVTTPFVSLQREPSSSSMQITQALFGERIKVFDVQSDWLWCQLQRDSYVGYILKSSASEVLSNPSHRVAVPSTFMYPKADIKSQPVLALPMNAQVEAVAADGKFTQISNGKFVYSAHLKQAEEFEIDFVAIAEKFLNVPYYWGGKTIFGLDCSGLVQSSLQACGIAVLRDTDLQEKQLGRNLMVNDLAGLQRGDLVFWKGHVGIMTDDKTLLHANGHHMLTVKEPLADAVDRIALTGSQVTSVKRLEGRLFSGGG